MCNEYQSLYRQAHASTPAAYADYRDPVRSEAEQRAIDAQRAKQQAAIRRAKLTERWVVWTVAAMLAVAMLPAVLVIAVIAGAVAVWRRIARIVERSANASAPAPEPPRKMPRDQTAPSVTDVGISMPRRRRAMNHGRGTYGNAMAARPLQHGMKGVCQCDT
jgi:hypothetical protein